MSTTTKAGRPRQRVSPGASLADRILLHTDRAGDCWVWTGKLDDGGYGRLTINGSLTNAHRTSYTAFVGEIPVGMQIDHLCRNRACCNPFHLEAVTPSENVRRGESPGAKALRRDLCLYGHGYEQHGVVRSGRRICRLCQNTYMRIYNRLPYAEIQHRKRTGIKVVDLGAYFAGLRSEAA